MELGERKLKILSAIVETFVKTGEPVGSKALCEALGFSVSSATIRNEMADLVEMGLLEQPHTSAGRVPSHLGYRLYINRLMNRKELSDEEQRYIDGTLLGSADDPEKLLEETSEMLAGMTNFAAVTTTPSDDNATVRHIQFVQTGKRTGMLVLMTSTGLVKNKMFRCDYDLTPDILRIFHGILNEKFRNLPLSAITPAFIQTMAASLGEMTMLMPSVLMATLEAASEASEQELCLQGQTNLLFLPEVDAPAAKRVMEFLNRRTDFVKLLNSQSENLSVLIGRESGRPELVNSSIVVAKYRIGGKESGAIGIIGPMRMDYAKMIPSLEYLAKSVGTLLSDLLDIES